MDHLLILWDRLAPWLSTLGSLALAGLLIWLAGCLAWDLVQMLWCRNR